MFPWKEKPDVLACPKCKSKAESIINCTNIGGVWPEGRTFGHITNEPKLFKNYKELDKYCESTGRAVETLTPAQLKTRQEDRRHKLLKGENPAKPKWKPSAKVPDAIDKAFRYSKDTKSALKALKEGKVK